MMNTQDMIKEIEYVVEYACKNNRYFFGHATWFYHIVPVVKYAKMLAKTLGAQEEVVEIAALLHDYAKICDEKFGKEHHIYGARMAEELLQKYKYPQGKIELVKKCIMSHRADICVPKETKEEECVASADAMAHIDNAFYIFLTRSKILNMNIDEGIVWTTAKMDKTWNKMCPEARSIMKEKYFALKNLLESFT